MNCGFQAFCGRPAGHRGHHDGWRSGIAAVSAHPVEHIPSKDWQRLGTQLSPNELRVLAEYAAHGTAQAASDCTGIPYRSVKNYLYDAHCRTGATSTIEVFGLLGWLTVPPDFGVLHVRAS